MKGLIVEVLRSARGRDHTNGGVSSKYNEFVIVDPAVDEIFEVTPNRPFGGNFVTSCDSRISAINPYPT